MAIKQALEKEALSLGFAAFGVAPAEYNPAPHNSHLRWLDKDYQGTMGYLERGVRRRFDPRVHLPGARSVIVCAHPYYSEPQNDPTRPYVSIYARGENYHTVLNDKLEALGRKMRELAGDIFYKIFVDSSPISEKTFAVKAGIGFIGRNGMVIIPRKRDGKKPQSHGSFHFLGLIITDLELEPDSPREGTCGQCRKCIETCPTEAIVDDGVVDANRCISYQTTQNKGRIPDDIARASGNMIFGCDICQIVCPYNSGISAAAEPRFFPDPDLVRADLTRLLEMTAAEFASRFEKSSIGEFKYEMFRRNAGIVNENIKSGKTEH
ncbi:MAG: tRNA epoxyqueuosine(34) reductase QueG [candidate division Zixibacteria bacterium RBG_16_53_22]|nr:MAG: tRNA epoxyqueuosine(34) reductase QueG [candidate division Zixibacteria bacterium RBG_16_53_22]